MPKCSIVGVRELNRLTIRSGTHGRYHGVDNIPCTFNNPPQVPSEAFVTPSNSSSLVIQAVTDSFSDYKVDDDSEDDSDDATVIVVERL
jgi:hypothetical protein